MAKCSNTFAQDTITKTLNEVVVTAQYQPQLEKNSLYKIDIIKKMQWENTGAKNVRELLINELNLNLSQNTVFGASTDINGISKENIKILVDGVPVIGRLNGIIDLMQVPLNNIERVEIVKGPVSVFYGTDAMGGVINLITKKNQSSTWATEIAAMYESINAVRTNGKIGYKFGKNYLSLNGEIYRFNGYSSNNAARSKNWEERNSNAGGLQYSRMIRKTQLSYSGNIFFEELVSMGDTVKSRTGVKSLTDNKYYARRIDNMIRFNGEIFKNHFLESHVSYNDYSRYHDAFNVNINNGEAVLSTTDTKEKNNEKFNTFNFRAVLAQDKNVKKLSFALGTDVYNESATGERINNTTQDIFTVAGFGSATFVAWKKLEMQPAARFTHNDVYGNFLSPAGNVMFKLNANSNLRMSYARGFRAPSIKELYLDFKMPAGAVTYTILGNTSLEVEKSHNFNINYTHTLHLQNFELNINPGAFYNDINDLITLSEMVNNTRNYINIEKYKTQGFDLFIEGKISDKFNARIGGTYIGIYNKYSEQIGSDDILYAQNYTASLSYKIPFVNVYANAAMKYFGQRQGYTVTKVNNVNTIVEITREDYTNIDCSLSKSFLKNAIHVALGLKNLLNIRNVEMKNEAGAAHSSEMQLWGRTFFINTIFKF